MDQRANKIISFIKKKFITITAVAAVMFGYSVFIFWPVLAGVIYPAGSLLQPNDVTSSHIRDNTILNADVSSTAAIAYSKLNLSDGIINADVSSTAAIAVSKLATSTSRDFITNTNQTLTGLKIFNSIPQIPTSTPTNDADISSKYYVDNKTFSVNTTAVAGINFNQGDAIFIASASSTNGIALDLDNLFGQTHEVGGTTYSGAGGGQVAQSFQFTATTTFNKVDLYLSKFGSPTDNFIINIMGDNANKPDMVAIASSSIAGTSITTSAQKYNTILNTTVTANKDTRYWVWFWRSGAQTDTHRYTLNGTTTNAYANGNCLTGNPTITATACTALDINILLATSTTVGNAYKASADIINNYDGFIGFANTTTTINNTVTIGINGALNIFNELISGMPYYLSNTAGVIAQTGGTITKKVGTALNSTTLIINNF